MNDARRTVLLRGVPEVWAAHTLGDTDTPCEASVHRRQAEWLRDLLKAEYPTLGFNCLLLSNVPHEYKATMDKLPALEVEVLI